MCGFCPCHIWLEFAEFFYDNKMASTRPDEYKLDVLCCASEEHAECTDCIFVYLYACYSNEHVTAFTNG